MATSLAELRKKPHTSISALRTFLSCPRKYHLQYVVRSRPDFFPAALALGSAWHEAAANWLTRTGTDETLDAQLREAIRQRLHHDDVPVLFDDEDENEEHFIERAVTMFKTFRESTPRPNNVLASEIAFETEMVDPQTGEVLALPVIGAIDAIVIQADGRGALWELKTAKKRWSADQAEFDLQTTLYRKAARELGFDGVDLRILVTTKTKLSEVQTLDIHRNDANERELAEVFFGVQRAVAAGVDHPVRGWQCRSCAHASSCRR